jgi:hypothetical protein
VTKAQANVAPFRYIAIASVQHTPQTRRRHHPAVGTASYLIDALLRGPADLL